MSDFDLTAPSVPYKKKKEGGILGKLFRKNQPAPEPAPQAPSSPQQPQEQVDLDEIKRKLGLDDELPALHPEPAAAVPQPAPEAHKEEKITIPDWTADDAHPAPSKPPEQSSWSAPVEEHVEAPAQPSPFAAEAEAHEEPEPIVEGGVHHEVVDTHLAPVDKKHETVTQALQKVEPAPMLPAVPDWKLQQREVPPESYFILRNGQPIRSLKELIEAIDYIDDSTFDHHVNEYRNDFANWIRDVIGNPELADEIQHATDRDAMMTALRSHHDEATKRVAKEHEKIQQVVKKREEALKKLTTVEDQIAQLKRQLEQKSSELLGERKRSANLIKEKLDQEVKHRLAVEKKAMTEARAQLAHAKQEYKAKTAEYENLAKSLAGKEKELLLREHKAEELMRSAQEATSRLTSEKREAAQLLRDAEMLKRQFEEMKKLDAQTKKNLELAEKRNAEMKRREDAIAQRELHINMDLSRVHEEQEKLGRLKEEHNKREAVVKRMETDARKLMEEADTRSKEALATERETRDRLKEEQKKLDMLRKQIDGTLAKALGQKKKITSAVALRKELEKAITTTKREVAQERKEMEDEGYKSYMETKVETTPAGQPDSPRGDDVLMMRKELPIYQMVEECRQALDRKDLATAKRIYNDLREEYSKVKIGQEERSALYTSIRELYDDIHLMMLG